MRLRLAAETIHLRGYKSEPSHRLPRILYLVHDLFIVFFFVKFLIVAVSWIYISISKKL